MNFVVLSTSKGTVLQSVIDRMKDGSLTAKCLGLVTDKGDRGCVLKAKAAKLPFRIVQRHDGETRADFDARVHTLNARFDVRAGAFWAAITYFAMQEVRRLRPAHPAGLMGLLTALYGLGQIIGPPMTARLLRSAVSPAAGFALALEVAACALLVGAALFAVMGRAFPKS